MGGYAKDKIRVKDRMDCSTFCKLCALPRKFKSTFASVNKLPSFINSSRVLPIAKIRALRGSSASSVTQSSPDVGDKTTIRHALCGNWKLSGSVATTFPIDAKTIRNTKERRKGTVLSPRTGRSK